MEEIKELVQHFQFSNDIWLVMLPIILMGLDFITGTINAWIKGELDSSKMRKGLGKKIGEMAAILIGEMIVAAFNLSSLVASAVSIYIIVMELISICENLEKLGVPIPKFIKNALSITNDKIVNETEEKDDKEEE
jgi:toxin secretion/phage lysis holin